MRISGWRRFSIEKGKNVARIHGVYRSEILICKSTWFHSKQIVLSKMIPRGLKKDRRVNKKPLEWKLGVFKATRSVILKCIPPSKPFFFRLQIYIKTQCSSQLCFTSTISWRRKPAINQSRTCSLFLFCHNQVNKYRVQATLESNTTIA
jgi:hypothetical protein